VVKDPLTGLPYIPGSSLKGKIRSLLEWRHGLAGVAGGRPYSFKQFKEGRHARGDDLLRLFGGAPDKEADELVAQIGPTRLAFWDCPLNAHWKETVADKRNLLLTEAKSEVAINRISGTAQDGALRFTERVIAGAEFDFAVTLKVIGDENLLPMLLDGLKLLELDSLGGSGSRGYGKATFRDLKLNGVPQALPDSPFPAAA
jgi:CRISPR-associated protein Csm3